MTRYALGLGAVSWVILFAGLGADATAAIQATLLAATIAAGAIIVGGE
jgi:hypothetical protein